MSAPWPPALAGPNAANPVARAWSLRLGWLMPAAAVFTGALLFYGLTLSPSPGWGDSARLQMDVHLGGSSYLFLDELRRVDSDGWPFDRLGVAAWDHPLYVLLGQTTKALPVGSPAWRLNLLSAVAGAAVLALVFGLARTLSDDGRAALLAALALGVSHTFWLLSVTAEVYTLYLVFAVALTWLAIDAVRRRSLDRLPLAALLAGLGLATHVMLILTLVPLLAWLTTCRLVDQRRARRAVSAEAADGPGHASGYASGPAAWPRLPPRTLALAAILFAVGFAPWWVQALRMARLVGIRLTLAVASGLPWLAQRATPPPPAALAANVVAYLGFLTYQFLPVGLTLAAYGAVRLWRLRRRQAALLLTLLAVHVAFSATYRVPDRFTFHLPSYVLMALFLAAGLAGALARLDGWQRTAAGRRRASIAGVVVLALVLAAPVAVYRAAPAVVRAAGRTDADVGIPDIGHGARDGLTTFLDPNQRGDDAATRFGRETLTGLAPGAVVLTPWPTDQETWVVLRYFQTAEALRPDVTLDLALFATGATTTARVAQRVRAWSGCRPLYIAALDPAAYPAALLAATVQPTPAGHLVRLLPRAGMPTPRDCAARVAAAAGVPLADLVRGALR